MKNNKNFKLIKKSMALLIIMVVSTALFAACGNKAKEDSANENAADATENNLSEEDTGLGSNETTKDNTAANVTVAPTATVTPVPTVTVTPEDNSDTDKIVYENKEYAFKFTLPDTWKDFTIVTEEWQGISLTDEQSQKVTETGLMISIRHPLWTEAAPRQDIPIMIFTLAQWDLVEKEEISLGAAPIGPSELGRNEEYVFALPARYNYAFITGFEEVDEMIQNGAFEIIDGESHLDN